MSATPWIAAGAEVLSALISQAVKAGDQSAAVRLKAARDKLVDGLDCIAADEAEVDAEIAKMRARP